MVVWSDRHLYVVIACALSIFECARVSAKDTTSVVEAVKAAEQRYRRFDSVIRSEYRHLGIDRMVDSGSDLITAEDNSIRVRVEGVKFRTDTDRAISTPRTPMQFKRVRAFDGATTRATEALVANVKEGAQTEDHLIRPHTAVFAYAAMSAPLGAYLAGADEFRAVPGQSFPDNRTLRIVDEGVDVKRELACRKISVHHTNTQNGEETLRRVLWLAVDRNLLPVSVEEYEPSFQFNVPLLVSTVEEFGQTKTGDWYPAKTKIIAYASWVVRTSGEQQEQWSMNVEIKSLDLDSEIDPAVFTDVDFSDARMAYAIDGTGKLVDSHPIGENPIKIDRQLKPSQNYWIYWLNGIVLFLLALSCAFAMRKRLSRGAVK